MSPPPQPVIGATPTYPRWLAWSLVGAFLLSVAVPFLTTQRGMQLTVSEFERRNLAARPARPRTADELRAFPKAFEKYFDDHFGLRERMVRAQSWIKAVVFNVSTSPSIFFGKDGWMFFAGEDATAFNRNYRLTEPHSGPELLAWQTEYEKQKRWYAELGIAHLLAVVPEKYSIYPEYLPSGVTRMADYSKVDQVFDHLRRQSAMPPVLDLRPALIKGKQDRQMYYKTDSHWGLAGAWIAYREIMHGLVAQYPKFADVLKPKPAGEHGYVRDKSIYIGDLAWNLGLTKTFRENMLPPDDLVMRDEGTRCAKPVPIDLPAELEPAAFECDRPGLPSAVFFRDSMGLPLIPLFAEHFRRLVVVNTSQIFVKQKMNMDPALILRERPEVVIHEIVERGHPLIGLLPTPSPLPK